MNIIIEHFYIVIMPFFHHAIQYKHIEFRQKYSATRHKLFSTLFSVFGYPDETLSLMFDTCILLKVYVVQMVGLLLILSFYCDIPVYSVQADI